MSVPLVEFAGESLLETPCVVVVGIILDLLHAIGARCCGIHVTNKLCCGAPTFYAGKECADVWVLSLQPHSGV